MDSSHTHVILPTNATSAVNPLAATTPAAVARNTVVQTNCEGEPLEYTEIISKGQEYESQSSTKDMTTTKADEDLKAKAYTLKEADVYKPLAVVSDSTPVTNANNQIVGSTASGSLTTPGKIVGDLETIIAEHSKAIIAEPVTDKVTKSETNETKK
ncbi:unnamed protein product [Adineta ricciae]|uniref:Uncharacterized protein n=1 Tax=Adineta ricciae TaxID=249248 RepID=A0A814SUK7_ADIRI|nr:unnamed protein product [Adineta ricciae]CAF1152740.1 unnamed protein product [Adineta ricciae]